RAVAPAAVEISHEGRAVVRGEDGMDAADLDASLGVARVLGELPRRAGLDDPAAHPARKPDPDAVDVGAGVMQQAERLGVTAELEPDLLEDRVGVLLDERQALLAEHLERRELAGQERDVLGVGRQPDRLAGGSTTAPPALGVLHQPSSLLPTATDRRRRRSFRASGPPPPAP